jgi:hypothetical protein
MRATFIRSRPCLPNRSDRPKWCGYATGFADDIGMMKHVRNSIGSLENIRAATGSIWMARGFVWRGCMLCSVNCAPSSNKGSHCRSKSCFELAEIGRALTRPWPRSIGSGAACRVTALCVAMCPRAGDYPRAMGPQKLPHATETIPAPPELALSIVSGDTFRYLVPFRTIRSNRRSPSHLRRNGASLENFPPT